MLKGKREVIDYSEAVKMFDKTLESGLTVGDKFARRNALLQFIDHLEEDGFQVSFDIYDEVADNE